MSSEKALKGGFVLEITCRMGNAQADAAFREGHQHLYHRICRLADNLAGYFLCGDAHIVIVAGAQRDGVPRFISATFDERADRIFEERTDRMLARKRFAQELPVPSFAVRLETEFADGGREVFVYDFGTHSDETLEAFCKHICARALDRFRHRFSARPAEKQ